MNPTRWAGAGAVVAIIVAVTVLASARAETPFGTQVAVESGALSGVAADGVLSFKGVPFAAPPVGDLRWRAPQAPPKWTTVRKADAFGHDCMQSPVSTDAAPLGTPPAEDCLVLNVWRPASAGTGPLPVIVWIYGGGFVNGGSSPAVYDGSAFARRGLVFVSFNYRLGRFGFFAHPALTKESPDGPLGNYAYLDQIAALQWIKRNVGAFGGDAGNVTVFGESAGGGSVFMLMTSPLARGLFHRAIIESGGGRGAGFTGPPKRVREAGPNGTPSGEAIGVAFAEKNGITGDDAAALAALRKLSPDTIVGGLNFMTMMQQPGIAPGPMIDGQIVTETAEQAFRAGHQAKVPLIIGANDSEIPFPLPADRLDAMLAQLGTDRDAAIATYGGKDAMSRQVFSDSLMVEPARLVARLHAAAGQPTWEYRFAYVATSLRGKVPGALHATEIPFVFATVRAKYQGETSPDDASMGEAANAYWSSFAQTGTPSAAGHPAWPAYSAASDTLLEFGIGGPVVKADPWKARLDYVEKLASAGAGTK